MVRAPRQLDEPTGRDASVAVKNTVREVGDVDVNSMSKKVTSMRCCYLSIPSPYSTVHRAGKVKPATVVLQYSTIGMVNGRARVSLFGESGNVVLS